MALLATATRCDTVCLMQPPHLALAIIGDEVGSSVAEMISFCVEHGIKRIAMRSVGGRNLLSMSLSEVDAIGLALNKAGLIVPMLMSPLLKWPVISQSSPAKEIDFSFNPAQCPSDDPFAYAFDVAGVLRAERMRVSSYLRCDSFDAMNLVNRIERILDLANVYSVNVELENEPECNVRSVADLVAFFVAFPGWPLLGRLKALPNIGSAWLTKQPTDNDITMLAPYIDALQISDVDTVANRVVPLGDGDVPWATELGRFLAKVESTEVLASIQTHNRQNGSNDVVRSIETLRRVAKEIGVGLV